MIIDYQNDFIDGNIGFAEAPDIESEILSRLEYYKERKGKIVFTLDTHDNNYINTQEGFRLPIEHIIKGTEGWEVYGKVGVFLKENREI